jgi:hypothetical protein
MDRCHNDEKHHRHAQHGAEHNGFGIIIIHGFECNIIYIVRSVNYLFGHVSEIIYALNP